MSILVIALLCLLLAQAYRTLRSSRKRELAEHIALDKNLHGRPFDLEFQSRIEYYKEKIRHAQRGHIVVEEINATRVGVIESGHR